MDHEPGNRPMEDDTVIKLLAGEENKIVHGDRCRGSGQLNFDVAFLRVGVRLYISWLDRYSSQALTDIVCLS
ncbi:MAG: hypothetical protein IPJ68_00030 [Candidatus Moraniibacteriota bacterium]|nr:MAG: hypothetical protein IPJ68_00030 [Candidatus Moranbacteria bacterium]